MERDFKLENDYNNLHIENERLRDLVDKLQNRIEELENRIEDAAINARERDLLTD